MRAMLTIALALVLAAGAVHAQSSTVTGISSKFNPAISVNALLLGRTAHASDDPALNGFDLQESEVQFTSVVDPYWKANLITAFAPGEDGTEVEIEVASLESRTLPGGFGLRVGQNHLPFGKHAPLHTHQFPFVDAPLAVSTFLGPEGLSDAGLQLSHELPLPWYADLTGYVGSGNTDILDGGSRQPAWGARLSNLFDLSMESTFELGGSWLRGPVAHDYLSLDGSDVLSGDLDVFGADATWKWVSSSRTRGPAATVTAEVVLPRPDASSQRPVGWYAYGQYRIAGYWWLGLGVGGIDRRSADPLVDAADFGLFHWEKARESKANVTWVPSEFSAVRLEVARFDDRLGDTSDTLVSLQFNFTIGSHPAHLY
ncbi:MAG TPA: hypothetical protein PLQ13_06960 [Candidatus Krumholzibacteria bacterium]|nr:hypothetical protein [Candidatus Krumholzibacteria bacterium]